ncbi:MAG: hypothetical protein K9I68_09200 [Bacteroidales bacterium]|nr:hypothetical protein [Bacteroidales bacterium]MCF8337550.1 hypothetical protein [Bacteroidales bacterium]
MAKNTNIWKSINFDDTEESALDLLETQKEKLFKDSRSLLKLEVEAVDSYLNTEPPTLALIYKAFIVAPELSNYRIKIFTVVEYYDKGRFPVDIMSHLDNDKINEVHKENFLSEISRILSKSIVRNRIKELYKLSKENKNVT